MLVKWKLTAVPQNKDVQKDLEGLPQVGEAAWVDIVFYKLANGEAC